MSLLIASLIVLLLTGAAALFTNSRPSMANRSGPFGCVLGGAMGIVPTIMVFFGSPALSFKANWNIPYGNFFIELDALTALFLLIIFFFSILLAFYGSGYLKPYLKTITFYKPDSELVESYKENEGKLPDGIIEKEREPKLKLSLIEE